MKTPLLVLLVLAVSIVAASLAAGEWLTKPARAQIGAPPADVSVREVRIPYGDAQQVSGWFFPGRAGEGTAPLLVASGTEDLHTRWPETEALFAAAPEPKTLWPVQGAAHVDLHDFDAAAYEARLGPWLKARLRKSPP